MALFPAYAAANLTEVTKTEAENVLENMKLSFSTSSNVPETTNVEERSTKSKKKHKLKKYKHKEKSKSNKQKDCTESLAKNNPDADDGFYEDRSRVLEFFNVKRIARPSAPKYKLKGTIGSVPYNKKMKTFKRYYHYILERNVYGSDSEEDIEKKDDRFMNKKDEVASPNMQSVQEEEEMKKLTEFYNRSLDEEPNNVSIWLKYCDFQNTVFQFEKNFKKGSIAKGLRVTAERQLSILDKALQLNPNNEELLRRRLDIAVGVYPSDELQSYMENLVEKEQSNIILWQGYIEATQCSMSHCTTPAVLNKYIKCLQTLHILRRNAKLDKAILEENILRILFQCGLFLKQSGLFEQLWTLLRLYLELNLSANFDIHSTFKENQLLELEELVLTSQLPIHELWLRIEKLREASHWVPLREECEDPQRIVFPEDVSELIHPITMPGNTLKLTVTILTLLKIPLLPGRHTAMKKFGIDYVPWSLDSIESLLGVYLPMYPINLKNELLSSLDRLSVGPQFLRTFPGQEEYLQFVQKVVNLCIDNLESGEKNAVCIWWMRFIRVLMVIEKRKILVLSDAFKKQLKADMKNLLKANSTNTILFQEYALVEFAQGNFQAAEKVLKTALSMCRDENTICSIVRSLIEISLSNNCETASIMEYFSSLISGSSEVIKAEFQERKVEAPDNYTNSSHQFLPDYYVDWTICHAWFVYFTESTAACLKVVEEAMIGESDWRREILQEFFVAVLYKDCTEKPGSNFFPALDKAVIKGIEEFPNNLFFLNVLAEVQQLHMCSGQPWWKIRTALMKTGHSLPSLFLILITQQRIDSVTEGWVDTITGQIVTQDNGQKNRLLALFKELTKSDMCTRRCGLVWRLYLQFLYSNYESKICRDAYYLAVEECPWLKALYIDAAIYIPEELSQIQDLIIEKQLRIHVTPEELEVLRK
ncbi:PREDICTED: protein NRDE2 homolog [Nicrophorus vespilloides]|uniref:Protein NRDE2 homolog n=1 Tax=Nicrophorus vespilloides TaxID=110193 RepID=A0ABM1N196_NICVS|nr:PREDICTED: protein NRDE2 homolog [Nicrophorus vespilloides]